VTAPCAFKGAQIKTGLVRFDADQRHRCAASRAAMNSEVCGTKPSIGLTGQHDTPLENQAGARHSQSPIVAYGGAVIQTTYLSGFPLRWSILLAFATRPAEEKTASRAAPGSDVGAVLSRPFVFGAVWRVVGELAPNPR